jgi:hypothetical protein
MQRAQFVDELVNTAQRRIAKTAIVRGFDGGIRPEPLEMVDLVAERC